MVVIVMVSVAGVVALRKESVDRNPYIPLAKVRHCVALRKESVDRNLEFRTRWELGKWSLSARRAWIEISDLKGNFITNERRSPQGERG